MIRSWQGFFWGLIWLWNSIEGLQLHGNTLSDLANIGSTSWKVLIKSLLWCPIDQDYHNHSRYQYQYYMLLRILLNTEYDIQQWYLLTPLDKASARCLMEKVWKIESSHLQEVLLPMERLVENPKLVKLWLTHIKERVYDPREIHLKRLLFSQSQLTSLKEMIGSLFSHPNRLGSLETAQVAYDFLPKYNWHLLDHHMPFNFDLVCGDEILKILALSFYIVGVRRYGVNVRGYWRIYKRKRVRKILEKFNLKDAIQSLLRDDYFSAYNPIFLYIMKEMGDNAPLQALWHAKLIYLLLDIIPQPHTINDRLHFEMILEEFLEWWNAKDISPAYYRKIMSRYNEYGLEFPKINNEIFQDHSSRFRKHGIIRRGGNLIDNFWSWQSLLFTDSQFIPWPTRIESLDDVYQALELIDEPAPHLASIIPLSRKLSHSIAIGPSKTCINTNCLLQRITKMFLASRPSFLRPFFDSYGKKRYRIVPPLPSTRVTCTRDHSLFLWLIAANLLRGKHLGFPLERDSARKLIDIQDGEDLHQFRLPLQKTGLYDFLPHQFVTGFLRRIFNNSANRFSSLQTNESEIVRPLMTGVVLGGFIFIAIRSILWILGKEPLSI